MLQQARMPFKEEAKLEPDYAAHFHAWQAHPTPATAGALLRKLDPVIHTAITSFGGGSKGSPTLKSHARRLALAALPSYDPHKGSLRTHLLGHLQRLRRISASEQQVISIPEQVGLDHQHLVEAEQQLRETHGRDPSDAEIADTTGLSLKRLAYVRQARMPAAEGGVLATPGHDGENDFSPAVQIPGQDHEAHGWREFIYHTSHPIDQAIMDFTLGLHGSPRLQTQEIAKRLGLSNGAISQRTERLQQRLDEQQSLTL